MRGLFVTFEGMDGSGKTTQARLLTRALDPIHPRGVLSTREPGDSFFGRDVRTAIFDVRMTSKAEFMLFLADRAQHVHDVIRPGLDAGAVVISDRYTDSTVAYQHFINGEPLLMINGLNNYVTDGVTPDITFVMDVEVGVARVRLESKDCESTRFDMFDVDTQVKLREAYLTIALSNKRRVRVIDGNRPEGVIHTEILYAVMNLLKGEREWHS